MARYYAQHRRGYPDEVPDPLAESFGLAPGTGFSTSAAEQGSSPYRWPPTAADRPAFSEDIRSALPGEGPITE